MPVRHGRPVVAAVTAAALVAAVGGALATPAPAVAGEAPRLMVSDDGRHWQGRLDSALFGDDLRLVPGASTTGTFWVKNVSTGPATLGARLVDVTASSAAFAETVTVSSHSDLDLGEVPPVTLADDGCTPVLAPVRLAAGQEAPITVAVALDESAGAGTDEQTLDFGVLVTLTGLTGGALVAGCAGAETSDPGVGDDATPGGAGGDRASSATVEAVATRASSAAPAGGAASSVDGTRGSGGGVGSWGDTDLPVHALDALDDFVPSPLRGSWLPLLIAAIAVLSGAFVAVGRRRAGVDDDGASGEQP
ncbi:hypothetical protein ITJ55_03835 [Frigoribacterium sp. VKM Ac-1396]|uniref:hypothetical protein n=1 Tax=Frigoribacterium sp. VKM Ac-1396 TaxID=2783821 RepID=UPI00188B05A5|nr:hypothetical protein [Frigoribacterium sp. VKM Ac-1396]MBF4599934.1 hypothetical protein [Frigoribacterium sp. VKM Ac-1396]